MPFSLGGFLDLHQRLAESVLVLCAGQLPPKPRGRAGLHLDVQTLRVTEVPIG
jgi:hypothetical protein